MFSRFLTRPRRYVLLTSGLVACTAINLGMPVVAHGQDDSPGSSGAAIADLGGSGNIVIDGGNSVGTVTSSNLRGMASLEESLGRRAYFESLSAINLQKAIDANLYNRRQSLQAYYEMRELREEAVRNRNRITHEDAVRLAKQRAPNRLTSQDYDPLTGEIFWPRPLDSEVLLPYTTIINESFVKRSGSDRAYSAADARRVERMVTLIQEAVDAVKKELPVKEYIALSDYLASISYEASHDLEGNRIDR
jgi:hypothetical protein